MKKLLLSAIATIAFVAATHSDAKAYIQRGQGSFVFTSGHGGILTCSGGGFCAEINGSDIFFDVFGCSMCSGTIVGLAGNPDSDDPDNQVAYSIEDINSKDE